MEVSSLLLNAPNLIQRTV